MQDQDDPSTYGNHTCVVKGSNHKRSRSHLSDSDATNDPEDEDEATSKRARADHSPPQAPTAVSHAEERMDVRVDAGAGALHDPDSPRINPIDHIFQFHKVCGRSAS